MTPEWRSDPLLVGRFHPEYPDDLQVVVHDGGPRLSPVAPELMWVRAEGRRGKAYVARVLNVPVGLKTARQGELILFLASKSAPHPYRVSEKYLGERESWNIKPCNGCGFPELWDAPSDLIPKTFPALPNGETLEAFTAFCPFCGGVQVVSRHAPSTAAETRCQRCHRELRGAARCLYCGWTADAELKKVDEAGKVPRETFRSGGTLWPFFASAFFMTLIALIVVWRAWRDGPPDHLPTVLFSLACLMFFGPVLFIVQLIRHRFIWAELDPVKGINVSGRTLVPWEQIASIDRYPGLFAYRDSMEQMLENVPMGYSTGCLAILAILLHSTYLPIISVLSPWHARVTIALKDGRKTVLRDLEESERFVRTVRQRLE